jgi:membrane protease YdiL (CAAX protease family)
MPSPRREAVETVAFFALAYALSWWPSLLEPHSILPLGPLIAALIVLAATRGREGVVDLVRRAVRWRVPARWYLLVLGLPPAISFGAAAINRMLGAMAPPPDRVPAPVEAPLTFLGVFLFIGVGEEPAWRGFALPRLTSLLGPLGGVLALAVLHALWHLPLFGTEYDRANGLPWLLAIAAYTFFTAWLYRRTDGNLLLPALLHASLNTSAAYVFAPMERGADLVWLWWLWAALWWVTALAALAFSRRLFERGPATP